MNRTIKKWLLWSGILASVVRIAADVLAAAWYPGYSFWDQTMSQLAAVGAPTQGFHIVFLAIFCVLMTAFGAGIWLSAKKELSLKMAGLFIALHGVFGLISLPFPQTAMQLGGGMAAQSVHLIVCSVLLVLIFLFIGFGAVAHGTHFRLYSAATVAIMLLFGFLTATKAPHAVDYAAPGMGILERISYYSYLLWIAVFSILHLRKRPLEDREAGQTLGNEDASAGLRKATPDGRARTSRASR